MFDDELVFAAFHLPIPMQFFSFKPIGILGTISCLLLRHEEPNGVVTKWTKYASVDCGVSYVKAFLQL